MMRITITLVVVLAVALPVAAQDFEVDTNTPEGQLLQQIGQAEGDQQKLTLLEQFTRDYAQHKGIGWVWGQIPPLYAKLGQAEKSLASCDKMLEVTPKNSAGAHGCLKVAEASNDPDLIKDWAFKTHAAAKKVIEAPKPDFEFEDQEAAWKETLSFSEQVTQYSEYIIYATALKTTDPRKKVELIDALRELNPENQYLPGFVPQLFIAYLQLGDNAKAVEIAEEVLKTDATNEDMLLVVAEHNLNTTKDTAKALEYYAKLAAVMETKPAPEGVAPEVWEKKRTQTLGRSYYLIGENSSKQKKYLQADKELRKALPYLESDPNVYPAALFHLGVANFQLGDKAGNQARILDAVNFTKQCAAIKSPYQAQAMKNLAAIQAQYRIK